MYDVEGSVAGIDQLRTEELPIVHEMGQTLFSERLSGAFNRQTSTALAQDQTWDIEFQVGNVIARILGLCVYTAANSGRIDHATVCVRESVANREIPIFVWDSATGGVVAARIRDNGAAAAQVIMLENMLDIATLPSMLFTGQPVTVDQLAFRGLTTGFGAGTVTCNMTFYRAFSQREGLSSRGLPIPSW